MPDKLRAIMHAYGFTKQPQLAEHLGLDGEKNRSQISKWITGGVNPRGQHATTIDQAYVEARRHARHSNPVNRTDRAREALAAAITAAGDHVIEQMIMDGSYNKLRRRLALAAANEFGGFSVGSSDDETGPNPNIVR